MSYRSTEVPAWFCLDEVYLQKLFCKGIFIEKVGVAFIFELKR
jgi:hypothetical protein